MKKDKNVIIFEYKCKKPKLLDNDVFVIYSPRKLTLEPGEIINLHMQLKIFLPRHIEGRCRLLLSHSEANLRLLNSNLISQRYNQNIDILTDNLPPWNLVFELQNGNYTGDLTIRKNQELGYFSVLLYDEGKIKYKFHKTH